MDMIQDLWAWLTNKPFQMIALALLIVAIGFWFIPPLATLKDLVIAVARALFGLIGDFLPYIAFAAAIVFMLWIMWAN